MIDLTQLINKYLIYYPMTIGLGYNLPIELLKYSKSQYYDKDAMKLIQYGKFKKLVTYAKQYVPYYKRSFKNIELSDILNIDDINKLPFISKLNIKEEYNNFQSDQKIGLKTKKTTGGSTGQPVTIWKSRKSISKELAAMWRGYSWAGIKIGDKQARFWGVPFAPKDKIRARLVDIVSNRKRISAFSFDEKNLQKYHLILKKFKPKYFYGYLSMLVEYAEFIKKNRYENDYALKSIISTSEVLSPSHRDLLETVFSAKVYNEYGCGEVGSIGHECEQGAIHVMSENIYLEIYDGNRKCDLDEIGEVVVTELNNYAMPLIRYRIGDYAYISSEDCPCGRKLPIIGNIFGRAYDTIENREGKLFHGEFFMYMFEDVQKKGMGVEKFQVIQVDYDKFIIKVIPGNNFSEETIRFIINRFKKEFDINIEIKFEIVDKISREQSGKMRLVVGREK